MLNGGCVVAKTKYTLLIPLNYNDGTKVPDELLDEIYNRFFALSDAYTLAGTVVGAYRMKDGSKQVDHSAEIWIGIDEDQYPRLRQLVAEVCRQLNQEAMYLEKSGGTIELIPPFPPGGEP
jgi:hypothetical protein